MVRVIKIRRHDLSIELTQLKNKLNGLVDRAETVKSNLAIETDEQTKMYQRKDIESTEADITKTEKK